MKEIDLEIPLSLSSITLRQYQDYLKVYERWDKEDDVYIKTKMLQIFCGLPIEDTLKIPVSSFDSTIEHLLHCLNEDTPLIKKFTMSGKDKDGNDAELEFGFIPKLDDISFGEFIDLETYMMDWQTMHKAMAVLFRPIIHKKKEFYRIDDYGGSDRYSDVMLDMPVTVALGASVFFYRLGTKLPLLTMDYLKRVLKKGEVTPQLKQILEGSGDGINRYIHSLKEMLEESMKLQKPVFTNVL
jgi:hypothetical protein